MFIPQRMKVFVEGISRLYTSGCSIKSLSREVLPFMLAEFYY